MASLGAAAQTGERERRFRAFQAMMAKQLPTKHCGSEAFLKGLVSRN
jgi:hypothetical protein